MRVWRGERRKFNWYSSRNDSCCRHFEFPARSTHERPHGRQWNFQAIGSVQKVCHPIQRLTGAAASSSGWHITSTRVGSPHSIAFLSAPSRSSGSSTRHDLSP